jgi:hypothetical protein
MSRWSELAEQTMAFLDEAFGRTYDGVLYHYTNQQGLLGIISRKEIWATHTQFLNDVREFHHGLAIARDVVSSLHNSLIDPEIETILDVFAGSEVVPAGNVSVVSFSEDGDSLGQWRAYGGPGGGFAIGITGECLRELAFRDDFSLGPCI